MQTRTLKARWRLESGKVLEYAYGMGKDKDTIITEIADQISRDLRTVCVKTYWDDDGKI